MDIPILKKGLLQLGQVGAYTAITKVGLLLLMIFAFGFLPAKEYVDLVFFWSFYQVFTAVVGSPVMIKKLMQGKSKAIENGDFLVITIIFVILWMILGVGIYIIRDASIIFLFSILCLPAFFLNNPLYAITMVNRLSDLPKLSGMFLLTLVVLFLCSYFSKSKDILIVTIMFSPVISVALLAGNLFLKDKSLLEYGRGSQKKYYLPNFESLKVWMVVTGAANWFMPLNLFVLSVVEVRSLKLASIYGLTLSFRGISSMFVAAGNQLLLRNPRFKYSIMSRLFLFVFFVLMSIATAVACYLYMVFTQNGLVYSDNILMIIFLFVSIGIPLNYYSVINTIIFKESIFLSFWLSLVALALSLTALWSSSTVIMFMIYWFVVLLVVAILSTLVEAKLMKKCVT